MAYERTLKIELHNLTLGRIILLTDTTVLKTLNVTGLGSAGYSLDIKDNALLDGATVTGAKLGAREISLTSEIYDYKLSPKKREELIHMFSPKHEYMLYVKREDIRRRISAKVQAFNIDPTNIYDYYLTNIDLLCPDPYFLDESDTTVQFRQFEPLINAPFIFIPEGAGLTAGLMVVTDGIKVVNTGDADFGIRAEITVTGGEIVNPAIWNNDFYVRVNTTLHIGDNLIIDTRRGSKGIWVKRAADAAPVKQLRYDPTSTWFTLAPGDNYVSFKADSGAEYAVTNITYSNRWLGV